MNNGVFIENVWGEIHCLIVNNDSTYKLFGLPSLTVAIDSRQERAINYGAISPNGKRILFVCDTECVFLCRLPPKKPTVTFTRKLVFKKIPIDLGSPAGYPQYCAWTIDSSYFAFTSEEGIVKWCKIGTPIKELGHIKTSEKFYAISFSSNGVLAFASRTNLRIMETKTWSCTDFQTIHIKDKVTGMGFSPDATKLFLATKGSIEEFTMVGIPTLVQICVAYVQKNYKMYWPNLLTNTWIPLDLKSRIFPTAPNVQFIKGTEK